MTELSNQTYCFFCQHELNDGQGRYRFVQEEREVECCLSCFDASKAFPRQTPKEPGSEAIPYQVKKEF